eukprot:2387556-Amphidinium_carterae.1
MLMVRLVEMLNLLCLQKALNSTHGHMECLRALVSHILENQPPKQTQISRHPYSQFQQQNYSIAVEWWVGRVFLLAGSGNESDCVPSFSLISLRALIAAVACKARRTTGSCCTSAQWQASNCPGSPQRMAVSQRAQTLCSLKLGLERQDIFPAFFNCSWKAVHCCAQDARTVAEARCQVAVACAVCPTQAILEPIGRMRQYLLQQQSFRLASLNSVALYWKLSCLDKSGDATK